MIGYKATDMNGCCRGFKFEVGKTYTKYVPAEEMECCTNKVFHFCRELWAIEKESNYKLSESRLFEVIAGDCVRSGDKYGTNSLTILREIEGEEKQNLINTCNHNTGNLTVWVSYDTATDEEKIEHKQEIQTCGGFLKTLYKEAWRLDWNRVAKEEHKNLISLPNWYNEIFKKISGIDAEAEIKKEE